MLAGLALCLLMPAAAQGPPHHPLPLDGILGPHRHDPPPARVTESTPEVILDATSLGSPLPLDKNWRVGVTANLAAATPDFDDSTWAVRNATEFFPEVPDEDRPPGPPPTDGKSDLPPERPKGHQRPWVWFRVHIKLAANHGPISLLVQLPVSQSASVSAGNQGPSVDVYANGVEIHPEGPGGDDPSHYQLISRVFSLNIPPSETSLTLVV
jgi:hypothetical protein